MFSIFALLVLMPSAPGLVSAQPRTRQVCGDNYQTCAPQGATIAALPPVGPGLSMLYDDLIQSINAEGPDDTSNNDTTGPVELQIDNPFCCAQTSECLLLRKFSVQFCWDLFTTDYYFPDGSYGSIVAGNFTSSSGTQVNLIYGNYQNANGVTGNIYSDVPTMMPDTSTLPVPTPWTSSGTGTAIPASELGSTASITVSITEVPMTTITAITLPSSTITVGTSICHACNFTIIPGLTGLPPATSTASSEVTSKMSFSSAATTFATGSASGTGGIHPNTTFIPPFTSNHAGPTEIIHLDSAVLTVVGSILWIWCM